MELTPLALTTQPPLHLVTRVLTLLLAIVLIHPTTLFMLQRLIRYLSPTRVLIPLLLAMVIPCTPLETWSIRICPDLVVFTVVSTYALTPSRKVLLP